MISATLPWDAATGEAIGATWLLAAIAPAGAFGRASRAREIAFRAGDEAAARAALARVDALARAASDEALATLRETIANAPDLADVFARARGGATLDDVDFFEVRRLLDALDGIAAAWARVEPASWDGPRPLADATIAEARVALEPGATPGRGFYLADAFDDGLANARGDAAAAQAGLDRERGRIAARAAAFAGVERVRDGEFIAMRDALAGPPPPEIRVLREAPTYLLCEIALDDAALAALARRDGALARVAAAEEAVRARLTGTIARAADAFARACAALGDLDALVGRARFARTYACVVPQIATTGGYALDGARYEPLRETLAAHARSYAPVALDLDGLGVVTGPNMGGKTAALRTLGFVAACTALGVPAPATAARVVLVDEIAWLGIGGHGDDEGLLSSFGREVASLRALLARDARRALVLVDEFARTTSPREGRALLVALLERLRERGAHGLAATHLTGIARAAGVAHYAVGGLRPGDLHGDDAPPLELDAALARIARTMDYRIARVDEDAIPAADALDLARALGLDARLVARARAELDPARSPPTPERTA